MRPAIWLVAVAVLAAGGLYRLGRRPAVVLLLGSDRRDEELPGRSDVMLVLRADPAEHRLRGVSLPRDLYVTLYGLAPPKTNRINTALFYGDYYQVPGGGLRVARETVERLLSLKLDGVALVSFPLVEDVVDTLGGVEIYFERPLVDRIFHPLKSGPSYTLRFESGWNYLDGRRALEFVRLRRPDTDFGRMERNRKLLEAMLAEARGPGGTGRLLRLLPLLFRELRTDLGFWAKLRLAWVFYRCSGPPVEWWVLGREQVEPFVTEQGAQVLRPAPGALEQAGDWLRPAGRAVR